MHNSFPGRFDEKSCLNFRKIPVTNGTEFFRIFRNEANLQKCFWEFPFHLIFLQELPEVLVERFCLIFEKFTDFRFFPYHLSPFENFRIVFWVERKEPLTFDGSFLRSTRSATSVLVFLFDLVKWQCSAN